MPRESCMRICVQHEPPALVNEFYSLRFVFTNHEPSTVTDVLLSVGLKEDQDTTIEQSTHLSLDKPIIGDKVVPRFEGVSLDNITPGEEVEINVYMKPLQVGTKRIFVKVSYDVEISVNDSVQPCACTKEEEFIIPTVKAFDTATKLMTVKFEELQELRCKEPFLMMSEITCSSPWPVVIETSAVKLGPQVESVDEKIESQLESVELQKGDTASECHCLLAPEPAEKPVVLGKYTLTWRRKTANAEIPAATTIVSLPSALVIPSSVYIDVDLPARGWMRTPLLATYTLYNHTALVQDFNLTMGSSDAFMFSGQKQLHFRVLPHSKHTLTYNLYPLIAGYVALPRPRLSLTRNCSLQPLVDALIQKHVPAHMFIMPQGKSCD